MTTNTEIEFLQKEMQRARAALMDFERTKRERDELRDKVERLRATPHQCPVCLGVGQVANGFYARVGTQTWSAASLEPERCRSCDGSGVVWQT